MDIFFYTKNSTIKKQFVNLCTKENIVGVKGYRSVGSFRVSLYNALPLSTVQVLIDVTKKSLICKCVNSECVSIYFHFFSFKNYNSTLK